MIRPATVADIPAIIDMIERLVRSVDGPQRVCRIRTGETLAGLIHDPRSVVLVSGRGFIAGTITQTVISPEPVVVELGWYAEDRSGLRLLIRFEQWSAKQGASLIKVSCKGGSAEKILRRRGYRMAEMAMVK